MRAPAGEFKPREGSCSGRLKADYCFSGFYRNYTLPYLARGVRFPCGARSPFQWRGGPGDAERPSKMHLRAGLTSLWLIILTYTSSVLASAGDRSDSFQNCIPICLDHFKGQCEIPLLFRLAQWTCTDECKYQCMWFLTDDAVKQQQPIVQYYGKWPFIRYAGMQEPASVAFSVLNLIAHVEGARIVSKRVPQDHPMRPYYLTWSYISINAWFWSSVFHSRGCFLPSVSHCSY